MMSAAELVARVQAYNPKSDGALLRRAYHFARDAHFGVKRKSGEAYISHPLAVAEICIDEQLDDATIAAALLHDTVEDVIQITPELLRAQFGPEVARIVEGVTKIDEIVRKKSDLEAANPDAFKEAKQAENFRKLLAAIAKDGRVLIVKLADRLHNMRTIAHQKPESQRRIAQETIDLYTPLAGRMGMQSMREQLEDMCFRVLNPGERMSLLRHFVKLRRDLRAAGQSNLIAQMVAEIQEALAAADIRAQVSGREKMPYSLWRKMKLKGWESASQIAFSKMSDVVGFRAIVKDDEACYRALWAVHRKWRCVPGRFKDYVSVPKANGYRSIHTTVIGPGGRHMEIQIRTQDMHDQAEYGVAAHWSYKNGERRASANAPDPTGWVRELMATIDAGETPRDFVRHASLEMYHDQVFCFTPNGHMIGLPRGATVLDFAFAVHTDIGMTCVGAQIDGRATPLSTPLRNGNVIRILTSKGQRPTADMEAMAVTGRAKSAIKRAARQNARARYAALGEQVVRTGFERAGVEFTQKGVEAAAQRLGYSESADLYVDIAEEKRAVRDVVEAIYPGKAEALGLADQTQAPLQRAPYPVTGDGVEKASIRTICPLCAPLPGERIVGLPTDGGRKVVIHAIDCAELSAHEDRADDWLNLGWAPNEERFADHGARLRVVLANAPGALGAVCTTLGEEGANIEELRFIDRKRDYFQVVIDINLRDVKHLIQIQRAIGARSLVAGVERISLVNAPAAPSPAGAKQ